METQKPAPEPPISDNRLQNKTDILENNLFNHLSKQEDRINLDFQISREKYPDEVIIKALQQLFPRINIKGGIILSLLEKLLSQPLAKGSPLKMEKQLLNFAQTQNPILSRLKLTLEIVMTCKLLHLAIKGTPVIPSQDEVIAKAFFDHMACPGTLLENGKINFREINRYPIVKAGDTLFFITPGSQGKPGMGFNGQIIQASEAVPLEFNLNGGVERVEHLDEEKENPGYFLKAGKTGVVVLTRTDNQITGIEIRDQLDVARLDYSTGNIGTHFICPISMKIDTICGGFKIRAKGMVEANVLEGGEIETENQAHIHTMEPGSRVTARQDIFVHFARNSVLTSETGCITILDELMDSTLFSREISFNKNKGTLTHNTLDADTILLKNIYFGGENTLYFGRSLFAQRKTLFDSREHIEKERLSVNEQEKELMAQFLHALKRLAKAVQKNPLVMDSLKNLIFATRTMDFDTLEAQIDTIAKSMNTKEVSVIKNQLETLKQIKDRPFQKQKDAINKKIDETDQIVSAMSLKIEGFLRRAATIKIHTGSVEEGGPQKPEMVIESEKNQDTFIKIEGTYTTRQGFKITRY